MVALEAGPHVGAAEAAAVGARATDSRQCDHGNTTNPAQDKPLP
jgi:hypothetical protein